MKETVLKGVAAPPQFFKAPYNLAIFNLLFHVALMVIVMLLIGIISPLYFMISAGIVHLILIAVYQKEPHIDSILKNGKILLRKSVNQDGEDGVKYLN